MDSLRLNAISFHSNETKSKQKLHEIKIEMKYEFSYYVSFNKLVQQLKRLK